MDKEQRNHPFLFGRFLTALLMASAVISVSDTGVVSDTGFALRQVGLEESNQLGEVVETLVGGPTSTASSAPASSGPQEVSLQTLRGAVSRFNDQRAMGQFLGERFDKGQSWLQAFMEWTNQDDWKRNQIRPFWKRKVLLEEVYRKVQNFNSGDREKLWPIFLAEVSNPGADSVRGVSAIGLAYLANLLQQHEKETLHAIVELAREKLDRNQGIADETWALASLATQSAIDELAKLTDSTQPKYYLPLIYLVEKPEKYRQGSGRVIGFKVLGGDPAERWQLISRHGILRVTQNGNAWRVINPQDKQARNKIFGEMVRTPQVLAELWEHPEMWQGFVEGAFYQRHPLRLIVERSLAQRSAGLEEVTAEQVREVAATWLEALDGEGKPFSVIESLLGTLRRGTNQLDDQEIRGTLEEILSQGKQIMPALSPHLQDLSEVARATVRDELSNASSAFGFAEIQVANGINRQTLPRYLQEMQNSLQRIRAILWELQTLERVEFVDDETAPSPRLALVASGVRLTEKGKAQVREKLTRLNVQAEKEAQRHPVQRLTVLGPSAAAASPGFVKYLLDPETPEAVRRQFGVVTRDETLLEKLETHHVLSDGSLIRFIEKQASEEIPVLLYVDEKEEDLIRSAYYNSKKFLPQHIELRLIHRLDRSAIFLNLMGIEAPTPEQEAEAAWVAVAVERYYQ